MMAWRALKLPQVRKTARQMQVKTLLLQRELGIRAGLWWRVWCDIQYTKSGSRRRPIVRRAMLAGSRIVWVLDATVLCNVSQKNVLEWRWVRGAGLVQL